MHLVLLWGRLVNFHLDPARWNVQAWGTPEPDTLITSGLGHTGQVTCASVSSLVFKATDNTVYTSNSDFQKELEERLCG